MGWTRIDRWEPFAVSCMNVSVTLILLTMFCSFETIRCFVRGF